jgi:hypothetical protein
MVNSATLSAISAFAVMRGAPSAPQQIYTGSYVSQFGVSTSTAAGLAIAPGTTANGAWLQLGTLTRPCCYWEYGIGVNDATMSLGVFDVDVGIGDVSNKKIAVPKSEWKTSVLETCQKPWSSDPCIGAVGDGVWARMQAGSTLDSNYSIAVYGVGG